MGLRRRRSESWEWVAMLLLLTFSLKRQLFTLSVSFGIASARSDFSGQLFRLCVGDGLIHWRMNEWLNVGVLQKRSFVSPRLRHFAALSVRLLNASCFSIQRIMYRFIELESWRSSKAPCR